MSRGGKIVCGGMETTDGAGLGRFFPPTIVSEANHSMNLMIEENFGP